jgi:hypothetical protein
MTTAITRRTELAHRASDGLHVHNTSAIFP